MSLVVYSDGGSRGNPGPSACAFVVYDKDQIIHSEAFYLGKLTNNKAEYYGVQNALEWLIRQKLTTHKVMYYLDSQLVVRQLLGEYKVKDVELKKIFLKIKSMQTVFRQGIEFIHVLRDKNVLADRLLNEVLDNSL